MIDDRNCGKVVGFDDLEEGAWLSLAKLTEIANKEFPGVPHTELQVEYVSTSGYAFLNLFRKTK